MVCEHDILNEHLYKTHFRDRCKFEIHVTILLIRQPMRWDGVDSNTRKIVPKFATRFAIISISEKKIEKLYIYKSVWFQENILPYRTFTSLLSSFNYNFWSWLEQLKVISSIVTEKLLAM